MEADVTIVIDKKMFELNQPNSASVGEFEKSGKATDNEFITNPSSDFSKR